MATYRVFDGHLISETELTLRRSEIMASQGTKELLNFHKFQLAAGDITKTSPIGFKPVGQGLPLFVEVRHLYTGRFPDNWANNADMLVTSNIKNIDEFGAEARAVNFLVPKQHSRTNFNSPPADQNGTPIVCYVPAVTAVRTVITFNLIFHNFDHTWLDLISSVFKNAASIPMFMCASPYLLGAGTILKVAGDVGDALFNGSPDFYPTVSLNFSDAGEPIQQSGFFVLFKTDEDPNAKPGLMKFDPNKGLVDKETNIPYSGPAPYLVVSVDGTRHDTLKSFAPTAASANILSKFFNVKDGGQVPLGDMVSAMKALNDIKYRDAADRLQKEIAVAGSAEEKAALQKQLNATIANILNPDVKPKVSQSLAT